MEMRYIARIRTDFSEKFGIPRQSGLVPELTGQIVFEPEYRTEDALRGLEGYSRLWLIWEFSEVSGTSWSPTVRPPRLGGDTRVGVFASRSPYRPNRLGLSCVKIESVDLRTKDGPVITVSGADMLDGTPIFDIKPYLPSSDAYPDALGGFGAAYKDYRLKVECPNCLLDRVPSDKRSALAGVLSLDPRPGYQHEKDRVYGLSFAGYNVRFTVDEDEGAVKVCGIDRIQAD